ncbi:hypothetical protein CLOM_g2603 [Closterium sp. NIES-68]|nr:hypothetical protein CLOM_g2603 [Closterium sp. NIES-68]GJP78254.1 hypothetical protein CLOP_g8579 [Closterium sp. NIES-67]
MSAATSFLPVLPWHAQRATQPLRHSPLPSAPRLPPAPPLRPVVVARAVDPLPRAACGDQPPAARPVRAATDGAHRRCQLVHLPSRVARSLDWAASLPSLLAGPASAALLLALVAQGLALPPAAAVAAAAAGMPAETAEAAAVREAGMEARGMHACSADGGEGQAAERWCAHVAASDTSTTGAATAGVRSGGERFGLGERLRSRYVLLRHGRSMANERGLIVSSLANGVSTEFGLAPEGRQQAQRAGRLLGELLEKQGVSVQDVIILASPFSRTQQTAAEVARVLGIDVQGTRFQTAEELRERYFGQRLELNSHDLYPAVWVDDRRDAGFAPGGDGESVLAVAHRVARLIQRVEEDVDGKVILLVSHGDTLQIVNSLLFSCNLLPSSFILPEGILESSPVPDPTVHMPLHRLFAFQTGELRPLNI